MDIDEYVQYDATGLSRLANSGEVTAVEITRLAREVYDAVNPRINAVVEFYDDAETFAGADSGSFNGVPFLRKDIGAVWPPSGKREWVVQRQSIKYRQLFLPPRQSGRT
ncbi:MULTISPECIES: hypothetical protein [unclassified Mesorhizobium]|uniref:hypothetical protein n=1 Tax=unclassified Mesorhizobium TaxID=325217 RepID=UPI0003CE4970|nr:MULTISPECIES: hypothetical protein [unclassified Mesorhizobium]ESY45967.1 hypothetical protein X745_31340 [Mesorhizobium sp. LNJC374B00]ESY51180.1 hypothetical protein X744_31460 [Mesorhizobium sp. LNJC372A00]WJI84413.1 hypothetical protein NLY34_29970 [Mesorhizobium sp. C374B]WJI90470.1 hypothetical protein NLY42_00720 [Mesorhizobium sp. C372A]